MTHPDNAVLDGPTYTTADVLECAARLIERVGLHQEFGNPDRKCALTAIIAAGEELSVTRKLGEPGDPFFELQSFLGHVTPGETYNWNDTAESASVVTYAMRETARMLSSRDASLAACAAGLAGTEG